MINFFPQKPSKNIIDLKCNSKHRCMCLLVIILYKFCYCFNKQFCINRCQKNFFFTLFGLKNVFCFRSFIHIAFLTNKLEIKDHKN